MKSDPVRIFALFFLAILTALTWSPVSLAEMESTGIHEDQLREVSRSKAWLNLLHYLPSGSGFKSELDGQEFFSLKTEKQIH